MLNGIIEIILTDPLTQLMCKILGISSFEPNAIGFYFNLDNNDADLYIYRIYDNFLIEWLPKKLKELSTHSFINSIKLYTVENMDNEKFIKRAKCIIKNNIGCKDSYDDLLLSMFHLQNYNDIITGYTLINKCFVKYNHVSNKKITNCKLKQIKNIPLGSITPSESAYHEIVQCIRKDIVLLLGRFANLFIYNYEFRNKVLLSTDTTDNEIKNKIHKNLKTSYIINFGNKLKELLSVFKKNTSYILNLSSLINIYNNLSSKIEPIHYEYLLKKKKYGISRNITLVLENMPHSDIIINNDQINLVVPVYNPNLSDLSNQELLELLLYIDGLNNTSVGKSYVTLQNTIVKELANRNTNMDI